MKAFTYLLGSAIFLGSLTTLGCGGSSDLETGGIPKDVDASKPVDMSKMPGIDQLNAKAKTKKK
jgi:hypothetical protein